jgi:hypothetical protein
MLNDDVPFRLQAGKIDPGVPTPQFFQISAELFRSRGRKLHPQDNRAFLEQVHRLGTERVSHHGNSLVFEKFKVQGSKFKVR